MIRENLFRIKSELPSGVCLVAVSKFHPVERLMEAYEAGQRVFCENRPQELAAKVPQMPSDVQWHFIGHLQTNKLKMVLPYVHMLESVDSVHLLDAVNAWCAAACKTLDVLLELHLGAEQTKHGLTDGEIRDILSRDCYSSVRFRGLMGMATNTDDASVVDADFARIEALFASLRRDFPQHSAFDQLSIGMSDDWPIALRHGATIIRLGSSIFGPREY